MNSIHKNMLLFYIKSYANESLREAFLGHDFIELIESEFSSI